MFTNFLYILRLVDILGIHMGLVTEAPPTPALAPEEDLETIIAPVITSFLPPVLTDNIRRLRERKLSSLM